jgi:hypothetical protein
MQRRQYRGWLGLDGREVEMVGGCWEDERWAMGDAVA